MFNGVRNGQHKKIVSETIVFPENVKFAVAKGKIAVFLCKGI